MRKKNTTSPTETSQILVNENIDYARHVTAKIWRSLPKFVEFDELLGYAMAGLIEAPQRFDPKKNDNFKAFAYMRIRGAIYDGLHEMRWSSRGLYRTQKNDTKTTSMVYLDDIEWLQIADEHPPIDDSLANAQIMEMVRSAVERLPDRDRSLIKLYYTKEKPLEDIGVILGFSKCWVSRLHARAIEKLSRILNETLSRHTSKSSVTHHHGDEPKIRREARQEASKHVPRPNPRPNCEGLGL